MINIEYLEKVSKNTKLEKLATFGVDTPMYEELQNPERIALNADSYFKKNKGYQTKVQELQKKYDKLPISTKAKLNIASVLNSPYTIAGIGATGGLGGAIYGGIAGGPIGAVGGLLAGLYGPTLALSPIKNSLNKSIRNDKQAVNYIKPLVRTVINEFNKQ